MASYDQESKTPIVSEHESSKPPAQIAPRRVFIPFFRPNVEINWLRSTLISIRDSTLLRPAYMMQMSCSTEKVLPVAPHDVCLHRIIDIQPVLP
jgi:hypothetical protein